MAEPWIKSVRENRELTVSAHSSLTGRWRAVFRQSVREFNRLSRRHKLGVKLAIGNGTSNVEVRTGDGEVTVKYGGDTYKRTLSGRSMHGKTLLFSKGGKVEKAYVYLPANPHVNTPWGVRAVGTNVMKLIAVHEFVHACGLSDADHSRDDLFQGNPMVDPGSTAAKDKVRIPGRGKMRWMPPFVMSGSTIKKVRSVW